MYVPYLVLISIWQRFESNPKMTLTITEYMPDQHEHNLTSTPTKSSSSNHTVELSSPSTNNNSSTDIMSNNNSVSYQHQVPTTPMINSDTTGFSMDYSHNNNNSSFSPYKVMWDEEYYCSIIGVFLSHFCHAVSLFLSLSLRKAGYLVIAT